MLMERGPMLMPATVRAYAADLAAIYGCTRRCRLCSIAAANPTLKTPAAILPSCMQRTTVIRWRLRC